MKGEVAEMVKRLEKRADFWQQSSSTLTHSEREYFEILDRRAAALLAKLGQGWIAVSERLPEAGRSYLVMYCGVVTVASRYHLRTGATGWTVDDDSVADEYRPKNEISHWMPLPPPPERP